MRLLGVVSAMLLWAAAMAESTEEDTIYISVNMYEHESCGSSYTPGPRLGSNGTPCGKLEPGWSMKLAPLHQCPGKPEDQPDSCEGATWHDCNLHFYTDPSYCERQRLPIHVERGEDLHSTETGWETGVTRCIEAVNATRYYAINCGETEAERQPAGQPKRRPGAVIDTVNEADPNQPAGTIFIG